MASPRTSTSELRAHIDQAVAAAKAKREKDLEKARKQNKVMQFFSGFSKEELEGKPKNAEPAAAAAVAKKSSVEVKSSVQVSNRTPVETPKKPGFFEKAWASVSAAVSEDARKQQQKERREEHREHREQIKEKWGIYKK